MERKRIPMKEAIERANGVISRRTVYRRFRSGELEGTGGTIVPIEIFEDSLDALLRKEKAPTGAARNQNAD